MLFILFGATGDLARSKLIPALFDLAVAGRLPPDFELVAVGRTQLTDIDYTHSLAQHDEHPLTLNHWPFKYSYVQVDFDHPSGFRPLFDYIYRESSRRKIFYFSLSPDAIIRAIERFCDEETCRILKHEESLVATEKPFGFDIATAKYLNDRLQGIAAPHQIYRIDHYLHKDTVRRLIDYRSRVGWTGDFWQQIKRIDIIASEQVRLGSRASYYDRFGGAINDFIQNHLLQLLALLTTEELSLDCNDARTTVINSLNYHNLRIGQYQGYLTESGVSRNSHTETLAVLGLTSSLTHLRDKSINLLAGKGLASKETFMELYRHDGQRLRLNIEPSRAADPLGAITHDAYYNLIESLIQQDNNYFVSASEVVAEWQLVDPINKSKQDCQIESYLVGTPFSYFLPTDQ